MEDCEGFWIEVLVFLGFSIFLNRMKILGIVYEFS